MAAKNLMKTMEAQEVRLSGKTIVADVKSVRDYKGAPQGMLYQENEEPKLVMLVKKFDNYSSNYWKPVCPS